MNIKITKPMMMCGHAANATHAGKPCCVICAPDHKAYEIDPQPPELKDRKATCPYCKTEVPSTTGLAFFEHRPDKPTDSYYCGCRGFD